MPLIRINARGHDPVLHGEGLCALPWVAEAAQGRGPVILMLHGYKFQPGHPVHCPHGHILAEQDSNPCPKAVSWPVRLGFATGAADEGLGIAFGWAARGRLRDVYGRAPAAGHALAQVVRTLRAAAPERPIHAIGHSMGARVILQAMPHLARGDLERVVLLAAAEYRSVAQAMLATPAGQGSTVINVTTRENALFDFLFERIVPAPFHGDRALGAGLGTRLGSGAGPDPSPSDRHLTLPIDDPALLDALARRGMAVAPPQAAVCHWSAYRRDGIMKLYATLLRHPEAWPLAQLAAALPPPGAPRGARPAPQGGARALARAIWTPPLRVA